MGRQIIFFLVTLIALMFLLRDAPGEFLEIWVELKATGVVSNADYDSAWAQFMLPKIALYLLVVSPLIIAFSIDNQRRKKRTR